jgi:predicted small secreted protein
LTGTVNGQVRSDVSRVRTPYRRERAGGECHDVREVISMRKNKIAAAVTLITLLAAAPLLSACNTTAGAGHDLSNAGKAIENSADKAQ